MTGVQTCALPISGLESVTSLKIKLIQSNASKADVDITFADYGKLERYIEFKPKIDVIEGSKNLFDWVKNLEKTKLSNWVKL